MNHVHFLMTRARIEGLKRTEQWQEGCITDQEYAGHMVALWSAVAADLLLESTYTEPKKGEEENLWTP